MASITGKGFENLVKEDPEKAIKDYGNKKLWVFAYNPNITNRTSRFLKITEVKLNIEAIEEYIPFSKKGEYWKCTDITFQAFNQKGQALKKRIELKVNKKDRNIGFLTYICDSKEKAEMLLAEEILKKEKRYIKVYKEELDKRLSTVKNNIKTEDLYKALKESIGW